MKTHILLSILASVITVPSYAATVSIANGDFEAQFGASPFLGGPDSFSDNLVTSWTGATAFAFNHGAVDPSLSAAQPTSGNLAAYMVNNSFLEQSLTHTINTGDTITLTVDGWINNGSISMTVDFAGLGAQPVDLGAAPNIVQNNVITWTATTDITGGLLRFETVNAGSGQARIDTVSMEVTPVPEPTSFLLLGLSSLVLFLRRRR